MEEELNEDELETKTKNQTDDGKSTDNNDSKNNTPKTASRKNSHTVTDIPSINTSFQKLNPKIDVTTPNQKKFICNIPKSDSLPDVPANISVFHTPISKIAQRTIQIQEIREQFVVHLESSDEDEVIEVALPPKPTITIDSSDEDDLQVIPPEQSSAKAVSPQLVKSTPPHDTNKKSTNGEREISASPVPSVVSSISDEFIRSDCIALNISSRTLDQPIFDFSLHGSDLIDQETPSKKKKKKKNKDWELIATPEKNDASEILFATPKSKTKKKKKKLSDLSESGSTLNDDNSNQMFLTEISKKYKKHYTVLEIPNADVYESDSNQSASVDMQKESDDNPVANNETNKESDIVKDQLPNNQIDPIKDSKNMNVDADVVDLTSAEACWKTMVAPIEENIVMANVTGFVENVVDPHPVDIEVNKSVQLGSTKVPAILNDNLDFDNLKGNRLFCNRRYSISTLRAEMDKFYNDSWGGEDFNHREIQKYMSRDKNLWAIDPKDRMTTNSGRKKLMCYYCNRVGHRDDTCRLKPLVCHMCGVPGHQEPRCPTKICVNCGSPNYTYSTVCRHCSGWGRITCPECGQSGHPYSHCPDVWRRYHNTIDNATPLEEIRENKKHYQLFCSGCTRRGHLVHSCRLSLRFSGLPVNSPYVAYYRPLYPITLAQNNTFDKPLPPEHKLAQKRPSRSPSGHPDHVNKRKHSDVTSDLPQQKERADRPRAASSSNHDDSGHMIQDNQVSDTSDVVTTAHIHIMKNVVHKLKEADGSRWLQAAALAHRVRVHIADDQLQQQHLAVVGNVTDQEAFQEELRDWIRSSEKTEDASGNERDHPEPSNWDPCSNIPKSRNLAIRTLNKAFASLKRDIGDPCKLFKELNFLQNHHKQLLKKKIISSKQVSNNRDNINQMLRKLNMVLLGQAGLADGRAHLRELHAMQDKLMSYPQKYLPKTLRQHIGQHYRCIFAAFPRDDYGDLVRIFRNKTQFTFKKKSRTENLGQRNDKKSETPFVVEDDTAEKCPSVTMTISKLVLFRRRLMRARPADSVHKKTRRELMSKLRCHISTLGLLQGSGPRVSAKTIRKLKKVQEQAQLFLTNV